MSSLGYGRSLLTGESFFFDSQAVPDWESSLGGLEGISKIFEAVRPERELLVRAAWHRTRPCRLLEMASDFVTEERQLKLFFEAWLWLSGFGAALYLALWCLMRKH